jgi:hypothetical protein
MSEAPVTVDGGASVRGLLLLAASRILFTSSYIGFE